MCTRCLPMGPGSIWGPPISIEKKNRFYTRVHSALLGGFSYPVPQVAFPEAFCRKHGDRPLCICFKNSAIHTKVQKQLAFLAV